MVLNLVLNRELEEGPSSWLDGWLATSLDVWQSFRLSLSTDCLEIGLKENFFRVTDGWFVVWTVGLIVGCVMDDWTGGWTDGGTDGSTNGWMFIWVGG